MVDIALAMVLLMVLTVGMPLLASPVRVRRRRLQTCLVWSAVGAVIALTWALLTNLLLDGRAHRDVLVNFASIGAYGGVVAGLFWSFVRWPE